MKTNIINITICSVNSKISFHLIYEYFLRIILNIHSTNIINIDVSRYNNYII